MMDERLEYVREERGEGWQEKNKRGKKYTYTHTDRQTDILAIYIYFSDQGKESHVSCMY